MRLSSIGDVVHTLPVAAALKGAGWEVDWLVEAPGRSLVEGSPAVDRAVGAPKAKPLSWAAVRRALAIVRSRTCDVALDTQGLWKSAAWARLSGSRRVLGFRGRDRKEGLSALLMTETIARPGGIAHVMDLNLALLGPLGIEAIGRREFPLPASEAARNAVDLGLRALGVDRPVLLNPGGGWASKLWPPDALGDLARRLGEQGLPTLVTWGPGEEALASAVAGASGGSALRSFPTTLLEYAELCRRSRLVVAADTGPLHIACAVGTPVVALFGPTDPARNGPFDPADVVVRAVPSCAPCYRRGCGVHAGVMATIQPQEVLAAVLARLAKAEGARAV